MERNYSVYLITLKDGKRYFGSTGNITARHKSMACYKKNTPFYNALKDEGWKNVKKEVIADHLSKADAEKIEAWLIDRYDTCNPNNGYNRQRGAHTVNALTKEGKKEHNRVYRESHKEYYRTYMHKYNRENYESIKAQHKEYEQRRKSQQKNIQQ